ncbi:hypothetical protein VVD49_07455 [Uliginosibacterium sp. H3]|uniref:Uncharacterized protein n=1 Tax=Uliginosibacterium silvisoli TaxID=3114758 RepID=A0ABU6K1L6_9RHOO|nr:hypothetical protein [Uliginosibacterium sp. H3]
MDTHELKSNTVAFLGFAIAVPIAAMGIFNLTPRTATGGAMLLVSGFVAGIGLWFVSLPINWLGRQIRSRLLCNALSAVILVVFGIACFGVVLHFLPFLSEHFYFRRFWS